MRRLTFCGILGAATLIALPFLFAGSAARGSEEAVASSVKASPATHKQKSIVTVANASKGEKLEDFCIDSTGRILALVGPADAGNFELTILTGEGGVEVEPEVPARLATKKADKVASAVRAYDAEGKLVQTWPVGFSGQAINAAPDGTIVIGGDGHVARFDARGKKLHEGESPQMTYIHKNQEEMKERAKEQLETDRATYTDMVKQFEDQLEEIKKSKKDEKDGKKAQKAKVEAAEEEALELNESGLKQIIASYKAQVKMLEKKTIEQAIQEVTSRAKKTHSISASDKEVFVTCPAMAGYGYGVWRTDEKFGQPKEIVKSLSGCCGQMDVQCLNGDLYVCENSRHRVARYDRDGKEIAQFGKRDRSGEGENFGGCCNPMNLCFSKTGNLYVSESNGVVKHFTPDGKYLGIVGVAEVQPGCKNSCVGVTADDSRLFYIDIYKSQIIVLARDTTEAKK